MVSKPVPLATAFHVLAAMTICALGGCATAPPAPPMAPAAGAAAAMPGSPAAVSRGPEDGTAAAVRALLQSAQSHAVKGDQAAAAAEIERALRLQPRNPRLWHHLAELRLAQQRPGQAETLALKSNDLAGDDPELRRANWRIVAAARRMRGDAAGARAALARAADGRR